METFSNMADSEVGTNITLKDGVDTVSVNTELAASAYGSTNFTEDAEAPPPTFRKGDIWALLKSNSELLQLQKNLSEGARSPVWEKFLFVYMGSQRLNFVACQTCLTVYNYTSTTGTHSLARHICKTEAPSEPESNHPTSPILKETVTVLPPEDVPLATVQKPAIRKTRMRYTHARNDVQFDANIEVESLKDAVWRLTTRIYLLEDFIAEKFGEVLGPGGYSRLDAAEGELVSRKRNRKQRLKHSNLKESNEPLIDKTSEVALNDNDNIHNLDELDNEMGNKNLEDGLLRVKLELLSDSDNDDAMDNEGDSNLFEPDEDEEEYDDDEKDPDFLLNGKGRVAPKRKANPSPKSMQAKRSRKVSSAWEHFETIRDPLTKAVTKNICKHCKNHVSAKTTRMAKHLSECIDQDELSSTVTSESLSNSDCLQADALLKDAKGASIKNVLVSDKNTKKKRKVWEHFETIRDPITKTVTKNTCKHCSRHVSSKATRMVKHLLDVCDKVKHDKYDPPTDDLSASSSTT